MYRLRLFDILLNVQSSCNIKDLVSSTYGVTDCTPYMYMLGSNTLGDHCWLYPNKVAPLLSLYPLLSVILERDVQ